ncbi:hypothetical protein [Desulfovibrio inopinatus]|uniref:hypothetical protein n=1 Tax=Desulfovibrio inopinatus TaxID=102109 RepID=UPI000426D89E|nr:hypothetical protein [Desulfovibrio inopinatus]
MEFTENLANEALTEMAETFFERRREIDLHRKVLMKKADTLRLKAVHIDAKWRTLSRLLLHDTAAIEALSSAIHFDSRELHVIPVDENHIFHFAPPWSMSKRGRYIKSVEHVYDALREDIRDYNDGTAHHDEHDKRRIVVPPHYAALCRMVDEINNTIDDANTNQPTSCVLGFARGLNVMEMERRSVTGAIFENASDCIDQSMAVPRFELSELRLPAIPTPPPWRDIKHTIEPILARLYDHNPDKILSEIEALTAQ